MLAIIFYVLMTDKRARQWPWKNKRLLQVGFRLLQSATLSWTFFIAELFFWGTIPQVKYPRLSILSGDFYRGEGKYEKIVE
jgi:hypothetical protein